ASCSEARHAAAAATWAIPPPIWPAPTPRTCSTLTARQANVQRHDRSLVRGLGLWAAGRPAPRERRGLADLGPLPAACRRTAADDPVRPARLRPLTDVDRSVLARGRPRFRVGRGGSRASSARRYLSRGPDRDPGGARTTRARRRAPAWRVPASAPRPE